MTTSGRMPERCAQALAVVLGGLLLLSGLPAAGQVPTTGYDLGPEDVLEVTVWGYPNLTRSVIVRPDGRISLPLVGSVKVAGITVERLVQILTRAYAAYIHNPQITVIVKEFRRIRVSALGQVARPGSYALTPGSRVLDLLSAAGGVTEVAALKEALLLRPGITPVKVDLEALLAGEAVANVMLRGGETLVVPEDLVNIVSVLGEVVRPGRYRLKGEVRLLDLLVMAGGLTEKASVSEARLVRASLEAVKLGLDGLLLHQDMSRNVLILPGDTVFIPEETNNTIYVIGDVVRPGAFPLKGEVTLLQAIGMAGGPVQRGAATATTAYIVRRNEGGRVIASSAKVEPLPNGRTLITVDLQALMRGADIGRDVGIHPSDVVVVPQSELSGLAVILNILSGLIGIFK